MWKTLMENSALILGLAISLYTIYSAANNIIVGRRRRKIIIRSLNIRTQYLITLGESLVNRADQVKKEYPVEVSSGSQRGGLPQKSIDDVEELLIRAFHVLGFEIAWDDEELALALTDEQLDVFFELQKAYQTYREVLTVRARQLKRSPDNAAELSRLRTVADWNLAPVKESFERFHSLTEKSKA